MQIKFPVTMLWREKKPGLNSQLVEKIDGRTCLAVFEDDAKQLRYHLGLDKQSDGEDRPQRFNPKELAEFVNGHIYKYVVVNPGSDDQRIYDWNQIAECVKNHGESK